MGLAHQALYLATAGAYANQRKLEVVANNLANVSTFGYKRDFAVLMALEKPKSPITPLSPKLYFDLHIEQVSQRPVMLDEVYHDFEQGNLIETGNKLDIAISGNGFFAVKNHDGKIFFTRAGNFKISQEGYIITPQGYLLLGDKGEPIRIPLDATAGVPENIVITPEGGLFVDVRATGWEKEGEGERNIFVDKIAIYDIPADVRITRKVGENLFEVEDPAFVMRAENYEILQGFIESSNVNPINEMVALIEVQRVYEANTRIISAVDATLSTSVRELGRV